MTKLKLDCHIIDLTIMSNKANGMKLSKDSPNYAYIRETLSHLIKQFSKGQPTQKEHLLLWTKKMFKNIFDVKMSNQERKQ